MLAFLAVTVACSPGTAFEPPLCPTGLPTVRSVIIERSGYAATRVSDPTIRCSTFRPTAVQVRAWLIKARRVPSLQAADATIDMVPCRARGTVVFANGRRGRWEVEQARFGNIVLPGRAPMLLYTTARLGRPFVY